MGETDTGNRDSEAAAAAIAAVLPPTETPAPMGYEDASQAQLSLLYATGWVNAGILDPAQVQHWLSAGVQDPCVARDAIRQGYRPEDPWVLKSTPRFTVPDGQPTEPPAPLTAWRNRRSARRAWAQRERERTTSDDQLRALARWLRHTDFDSGQHLYALELLDATRSEISADDVARAFAQLTAEVAAAPANPEDDRHPTGYDEYGQLSGDDPNYYQSMSALVRRHLSACPPAEQRTMRAELDQVDAWISTRS